MIDGMHSDNQREFSAARRARSDERPLRWRRTITADALRRLGSWLDWADNAAADDLAECKPEVD
jgi:hypothetical protein